jgi:hypothetical protein
MVTGEVLTLQPRQFSDHVCILFQVDDDLDVKRLFLTFDQVFVRRPFHAMRGIVIANDIDRDVIDDCGSDS